MLHLGCGHATLEHVELVASGTMVSNSWLLSSTDVVLSVCCCLPQGQSKLCNLLFARELQQRLTAEGAPVTAVACHPGMAI